MIAIIRLLARIGIAIIISGACNNQQTVTFTARTDAFANPGIGYQTVNCNGTGDANLSSLPTSTYYNRWDWSTLEPSSPGAYNWTNLDNDSASTCLNGGAWHYASRIMGFEDGNTGVQSYKSSGYAGNTFTFNATGSVYFPAMSNATVKTAMANAVGAIKSRYGTSPNWDSVDLGFVGAYGEWQFTGTSPAQSYPATADLQTFISDWTTGPPSFPMLVNGDLYLNNTTAFASAMSAGVGWRVDCWQPTAQMTSGFPWYATLIAAYPNQWQTAPVYLETCSDIATWNSSGWNVQTALDWAVANHASAWNTKSVTIPAGLIAAVQDNLTKIGYRFQLTQARLPPSATAAAGFQLTLNWNNVGNAPMYFDRHILVRVGTTIIDSGISMKGRLPGTSVDNISVNTSAIPAGTYLVSVSLAKVGTTTPDITLAITGSGPWYGITNITLN